MAIRGGASGRGLRRTTDLPSVESLTILAAFNIHALGSGYRYGITLEDATTNASNYNTVGFHNSGAFQISYNGGSNNFASNPTTGRYWIYLRRASGTYGAGFCAMGGTTWVRVTGYSAASWTLANLELLNDSWDEPVDWSAAGVRIWNVALTDAELDQEVQTLVPRRWADLHLWTPMIADNLTDAVKDYSGNGRDWSVLGSGSTIVDGPPVAWGSRIILPQISTTATVYELDAGAGTYSTSGQAATMLAHRSLGAGAGEYALTGADAMLHKVGAYALDAQPGSYVVTGRDATLGQPLSDVTFMVPMATRPASRFRPWLARPLARSELVIARPDGVAARASVGLPRVDDGVVNVVRAPLPAYRPVSRFRPRIGGITPNAPPSNLVVQITASSVVSVPVVGAPRAISGGVVIFPDGVATRASLGEPALTEGFTIDGGGDLPEGITAAPVSVGSRAAVGAPEITDSGATIEALSVGSVAAVGNPAVAIGPQVWASPVESVAAVGAPLVEVPVATVLADSVLTMRAVGSPQVGLLLDLFAGSVERTPVVGEPSITEAAFAKYGTRGSRTRNLNKQGGGGRPAQLA